LLHFGKAKKWSSSLISASLALLQASEIQEIIPPIKTIDGKLTQHINDSTLIVYPFVDEQKRGSGMGKCL
jgi:spectinomycin phosphotransferase